MNGAEALIRTLVDHDVEVCFANPGTSEMHFVSALDRVPQMRSVLGLFEGVVTGAADGYYRMADRPACTLLHLGPGLGNGIANLHNAKKARSGIVNVVGQHATPHLEIEAPLSCDIEGLAGPVSTWVRSTPDAPSVEADAKDAIAHASNRPGGIATLILPGDAAWNEAGAELSPRMRESELDRPDPQEVETSARALEDGHKVLFLLGGRALRAKALEAAGKIAARMGCTLATNFFNARIERGAGRVPVRRLAYAVDPALEELKDFTHIITVQTDEPTAFFSYPNRPSRLKPDGCKVIHLCSHTSDPLAALEALCDRLGAGRDPVAVQEVGDAGRPQGELTPGSIAQALAVSIPENAIVVDESLTTGRQSFHLTAGAKPHDWLQNMGGSIGFGTPVATGAAVACPDRPVMCLVGDGSAMYTVQSLWTQAREGLNITTLIFANRKYQILKGEFGNVGAGQPGPAALDMLEIDRPSLDWVAMAKGMGVPAIRVETVDALCKALETVEHSEGPRLVEVVLP